AYGMRVDHLDGLDRRQLARPVRALQRAVAVERELDRPGVHRRAVVELDAGAQLDGDSPAAVRDRRKLGGELRREPEALVDLVEVLADVRENNPAHVGASQRGIENVGILEERDDERLLLSVRGVGQAERDERGDGEREPSRDPAHVISSGFRMSRAAAGGGASYYNAAPQRPLAQLHPPDLPPAPHRGVCYQADVA